MDLISTILTASITSGVVTALLNWIIKSRQLGEQRRWEIKREACLEALEIIDARFADYRWTSDGIAMKIDEQDFIPTARIRSCFNRLLLACKDSTVPQQFEDCLNLRVGNNELRPITMGEVVKLRNAIRKEMGFGKDISTKVDWISNINWRRDKKETETITSAISSEPLTAKEPQSAYLSRSKSRPRT